MMWFKREPKTVGEKENGVVGKLRRKKAVLLKPTRESSERETSTESDKERRRYSDILDMKASLERRDESDESLYESADGHSDAISASDDALPRLIKTPTMSKESLKLAVTDEEVDLARNKKGHRKTMSLSNPLEMVKNLGDEWFDSAKRELDKKTEKNKSRESLWSEEERDSINGSRIKLDQSRKNSKKEDKSQSNSRKSSTNEPPMRKVSKGSSVSALNFLRRKKTPTSMKTVEAVAEAVDKIISADEILNGTRFFLEAEKLHASISESKPAAETDSDEEPPTPTPKPTVDHRRRLSRQASRSKSKARGKSQSVKVNTLRKSHSGTLKKAKKKGVKTPLPGRSRQSSIVESTPLVKKKNSDTFKNNSWIFSGYRGESRREGSTDDAQPDNENEANDNIAKDILEKDNTSRTASTNGRGVNRAESCRERDAPRRGKHRNASDPNRLTAHAHHDLEPGAVTAPSGSSSSSSLSSRSNESNTVAAEQQASQSDWSEEDEPLPAQWVDSLPPQTLDSLPLSAAHRKRQEVIHELIVSEGSHVRWLKVLATVFHRPLERQPTLLPPEDLRNLFPNLSGVRERHGRLYTELRAARSEASHCVLSCAPVAEALLNTLGDPNYAPCLSRFCRNQRFALDALRERRRKHKELQQFLCAREHLPQCGRLQLNDLLACVWQRLTKYQLLLESILKTFGEDEDAKETEVLRKALTVAKEVLHSVDMSIRKAENEHRLKSIQNKLEIRAPNGSEWEELRRLDLTTRTLKYEAELGVRQDNKRTLLLALMLEDSLVLLHREGDKFVLKPIAQSNMQGPLSPLVKWDKVLFRPNAAVRNTFFLMNINGVQMHELSANTAAEYNLWVKHIQGAPLILTEVKPPLTHSHQASRSQDDSGINVSRNPSDASEKSDKSEVSDKSEKPDKLETSDVPAPAADKEEEPQIKQDRDVSKEPEDKEERDNTPRHALLRAGSSCSTGASPLVDPATIVIQPPVQASTAVTHLTVQERLRRLDLQISSAMRAKSDCVAEILGIKQTEYSEMADLAVADAHSQLDEYMEPFDRVEATNPTPDFYQLLLAAQTQANQLLEIVSSSLGVEECGVVAMRTAGRCDGCARQWRRAFHSDSESVQPERTLNPGAGGAAALPKDISFDMLSELEGNREGQMPHLIESCNSAALLSRRLVPLTMNIQCSLTSLLSALPVADNRTLRAELASTRDRCDRQAARLYQTIDASSFPKTESDADTDPLQEQPSNGG